MLNTQTLLQLYNKSVIHAGRQRTYVVVLNAYNILQGIQKMGELIKVNFAEEDKEHCGLRGLTEENKLLYRVLREDEDIEEDIESKLKPVVDLQLLLSLLSLAEYDAKEAVKNHVRYGRTQSSQFMIRRKLKGQKR